MKTHRTAYKTGEPDIVIKQLLVIEQLRIVRIEPVLTNAYMESLHTPTVEERKTYFNISKHIAPKVLELYVPFLEAMACRLLTVDDIMTDIWFSAMCDVLNDINWFDVQSDVQSDVPSDVWVWISVCACLMTNMTHAVLGSSRDMREAAAAGLPRSVREAARRICARFLPKELPCTRTVGAEMPMAAGNQCLTELRRSCSVCGALTMKRCSRCRVAFFCGEACMAAAWSATHRAACRAKHS